MPAEYFDWEAVEDPKPDWDGRFTLKVPLLDERVERDWAEAFVHITNRGEVRGGSWGTISIYTPYVEVDDVAPGSEQALRQFLEHAAVQAESVVQRERERGAEMGDRFRSRR